MLLACAGSAGAGESATYVDDVFNTYCVDGADGQTIVNGIDLATHGGLVWTKARDQNISYAMQDTERGANKYICSDSKSGNTDTSANSTWNTIKTFNTDGFTTGPDALYGTTDNPKN